MSQSINQSINRQNNRSHNQSINQLSARSKKQEISYNSFVVFWWSWNNVIQIIQKTRQCTSERKTNFTRNFNLTRGYFKRDVFDHTLILRLFIHVQERIFVNQLRSRFGIQSESAIGVAHRARQVDPAAGREKRSVRVARRDGDHFLVRQIHQLWTPAVFIGRARSQSSFVVTPPGKSLT